MQVRPYQPEDEKAVIELWRRCHLVVPWNDPKLDIQRTLKVNPELFLVGLIDEDIVATVMGGYDGHRGWVHYLAVSPDHRYKGYAREIMAVIEEELLERGCPKINLQIRTSNPDAIKFYQSIGYKPDAVMSMGKRLIEDS